MKFYENVDRKRRSVHPKIHAKSDLLVYQCEIGISSKVKVQVSNFKKDEF